MDQLGGEHHLLFEPRLFNEFAQHHVVVRAERDEPVSAHLLVDRAPEQVERAESGVCVGSGSRGAEHAETKKQGKHRDERPEQRAFRDHSGERGQVLQLARYGAAYSSRKRARMEHYVGVGKQQPLTLRLRRAHVQRVVFAEPATGQLADVNHPETWVLRFHPFQNLAGSVGRTVVEHANLEVRIILGEHRLKARLERVRFVERRNHYRQPWRMR